MGLNPVASVPTTWTPRIHWDRLQDFHVATFLSHLMALIWVHPDAWSYRNLFRAVTSQCPFQWFYWNLGDRNHVELFCKITSSIEPTTLLPNMIKRIGVHVECIFPQITKTIFHRLSLLRGPTCISRTPNHNLCPTQTTSRRLLLKLKPRKVIRKRNWALPTRICKYLYGTQACSHCRNYLPRVARIHRNRLQALIWVHLHWHNPLQMMTPTSICIHSGRYWEHS